ncbi:hypothetical protein [Micromonospora sp. C41]|uniref:hypothetical protein n=1 Tax=Micromonospora sp. C41 TaxID=2824878 RepID=UPI001B3648E5|nr:hypothetical protein [Micromonospora sp. C41]MBQ1061313.1 hypothetical protein [Micromonospora sp. C41]
MSARVVGLDLSMTGTGIAWCDGTTYTVKPRQDGDARLSEIRSEVARAVDGRRLDLVVIEDLPINAKGAGITGMVHGVVRTWLRDQLVPYALVVPSSLKKYATGNGNANKTDMALAAYKHAAREFRDDNQCDAWWLREMGLDQLGLPVAKLPAAQRASLKAVKWPGLIGPGMTKELSL